MSSTGSQCKIKLTFRKPEELLLKTFLLKKHSFSVSQREKPLTYQHWKIYFTIYNLFIWQLCEISTEPRRRRWMRKLNLYESTALHPTRRTSVRLQIKLKDGEKWREHRTSRTKTQKPYSSKQIYFYFISFWFVSFGSHAESRVKIIFHSIKSALWQVTQWNNPVAGKMGLKSAWLCFFFKYNGLGNEPSENCAVWGTPAA